VFRYSLLLVSEAIGGRNVAAVEPDRIQTRCRGGGARARLPDNQTGLDCGTGQPRRRAILIGTPRWAYHVVLQRNTGRQTSTLYNINYPRYPSGNGATGEWLNTLVHKVIQGRRRSPEAAL
jgi:hypothetical protein